MNRADGKPGTILSPVMVKAVVQCGGSA